MRFGIMAMQMDQLIPQALSPIGVKLSPAQSFSKFQVDKLSACF